MTLIIITANHKNYLSKVVTNLFLFTCSSCLRFDDQASKHNQSEIILFEKIVKSEKSFLQFAKVLNSSFELDNLNIKKFYKKLGKNVKSYNNTFYWPETFKNYFYKKVNDRNLNLFYKKMKYKIE